MEFKPHKIRGSESLIEIFGTWPSFHDAEVLRLTLDRRGASGAPDLEAEIHVFEMTSTVTPDGFYELRNHTRVTLLFEGVDELRLEEFNHQNALMSLALNDISSRQLDRLKWEVSFDAANGLDATFLCERVTVTGVERFEPPVNPPSPGGTQSPPRAVTA